MCATASLAVVFFFPDTFLLTYPKKDKDLFHKVATPRIHKALGGNII
jgi:hypothetical protein